MSLGDAIHWYTGESVSVSSKGLKYFEIFIACCLTYLLGANVGEVSWNMQNKSCLKSKKSNFRAIFIIIRDVKFEFDIDGLEITSRKMHKANVGPFA
jgi:hypothetical protein